MTLLTSLLYLFVVHATYTLAGPCMSVCRDPDDCPPAPAQPGELLSPWQSCPGKPAKGAKWACQASDLNFPTVECLTADMRTCGLVGQGGRSTVFYSFGATTVQARTKVRDTLQPKGVMFNDALDEDYWASVIYATRFRIDVPDRQEVFVARYAEAMATASKGQIFFVVKKYNGDGGGQGAYQLPPSGNTKPNVWRSYEFPTLQRNAAIINVTTIDLSDNLKKHLDWQPNSNDEELPASGASDLPVPPPPPSDCARRMKRQDAAACVPCITIAPPGGTTGIITISGTKATTQATSTSPAPTITPASTTPAPPSPPPPPPPPVCSAGFYGTDTNCDGKCNGAKAKCECIEAGYESFNNACTCSCG